MTESSKRAPFIVIEGLDRSGKTTQTEKLYNRLQDAKIDAKVIKFPGQFSATRISFESEICVKDRTTAIGKMIDSYLRSMSDLDDHAVHLLFSANRWEVKYVLNASHWIKLIRLFVNVYRKTIENFLNAGTTIICDRYAFSGIAFSASKVTPAGEPLLPFEWCRSPDVGLPAPDLVIFFDVTPEIARERGGFGQERYENEGMQLRVRQFFHRIGDEMREQSEREGGTRWVSIDAGRGRDEVAEEIWSLVEPLMSGPHGPLRKLWHQNNPGHS